MNTYTATINFKKFFTQADSTSQAVQYFANRTGVPAIQFAHTVRMVS